MKICISALTDTGLERENNEDACIYCPDLEHPSWPEEGMDYYKPLSQAGSLLVVADGMGGTNAGEVASALAIETVSKAFTAEAAEAALSSAEATDSLLVTTIRRADKVINERIIADPDTAGMGTTIVLCWLQQDKARIAWCGDSRCYLLRKGQLRLLTKDHSYVQELVDSGKITPEEAFNHPDSNIITRGLGDFDSAVEPDLVSVEVEPEDTFLLCSDGLCGYCTDEQIAEVMQQPDVTTEMQADRLLHLALDAGGYDNISIVVANVLDDNAQPPTPPSTGLWNKLKKLLG
ncbi:MAG: Stp1/IreP family PP2C-type Ser/Thr phosphatase [Prevotella sp.]|nr:Stp1/IreP family PP2C-type Ser/Thr phosphatase [Prevotella sp.]